MSAPRPVSPHLDEPGLAELATAALAAPARIGRRLVIGSALALAGLLGLLVLAAGAAFSGIAGGPGGGSVDGGCVPTPAGGPAGPPGGGAWSAEQRANASVIVSTGRGMGVPDRGVWIGLAAALQESGLRNLAGGDRDSVGLFQQRPSAGWGTPAQIRDPGYAAGQFFRHLLAVPGWQNLPMPQAAQAVQRSAFPDAYARWADTAARLLASLAGGADPTPCAPPAPPAPTAAANQEVSAVLTTAHAQLGKPYLWGAAGPNAYDCSGLTLTAFKAAGVTLPRTAAAQAASAPHVPLTQLQPGDLLFWSYTGQISGVHHVAIYAGDGQILEAANTGIPVRIRPVRLPGPTGVGGERELMPFAARPIPASSPSPGQPA